MSARYGVAWGNGAVRCTCSSEAGLFNGEYVGNPPLLVWENKADAQAYRDSRGADCPEADDYEVVRL